MKGSIEVGGRNGKFLGFANVRKVVFPMCQFGIGYKKPLRTEISYFFLARLFEHPMWNIFRTILREPGNQVDLKLIPFMGFDSFDDSIKNFIRANALLFPMRKPKKSPSPRSHMLLVPFPLQRKALAKGKKLFSRISCHSRPEAFKLGLECKCTQLEFMSALASFWVLLVISIRLLHC